MELHVLALLVRCSIFVSISSRFLNAHPSEKGTKPEVSGRTERKLANSDINYEYKTRGEQKKFEGFQYGEMFSQIDEPSINFSKISNRTVRQFSNHLHTIVQPATTQLDTTVHQAAPVPSGARGICCTSSCTRHAVFLLRPISARCFESLLALPLVARLGSVWLSRQLNVFMLFGVSVGTCKDSASVYARCALPLYVGMSCPG